MSLEYSSIYKQCYFQKYCSNKMIDYLSTADNYSIDGRALNISKNNTAMIYDENDYKTRPVKLKDFFEKKC